MLNTCGPQGGCAPPSGRRRPYHYSSSLSRAVPAVPPRAPRAVRPNSDPIPSDANGGKTFRAAARTSPCHPRPPWWLSSTMPHSPYSPHHSLPNSPGWPWLGVRGVGWQSAWVSVFGQQPGRSMLYLPSPSSCGPPRTCLANAPLPVGVCQHCGHSAAECGECQRAQSSVRHKAHCDLVLLTTTQ